MRLTALHAPAALVSRHRNAGPGGGDAGLGQQMANLTHLRGRSDGHHASGGSGARGTTRTVGVGLVLHRRIGVHHQRHVVDVDATRGDVGGHQRGGGAVGERGQVAFACRLRQVAVHVDGGHTERLQLGGHLLGAVFRAGEDHDALGARELGDGRQTVGVLHHHHAVIQQHRCFHLGRVRHRVVQVARHDGIHSAGQGGREQHALTLLRRGVQNALHHGQKALIGHVIGLVDDGDLDAIEARVALTHVIDEASGTGHHDLGTGAQTVALRSMTHASEDGDHAQPDGHGQGFDDPGHLRGQFARGHQHQRAGAIGLTRRLGGGETGHQRKRERDGLARAGATLSQHVATGQGVRQRDGLNGERIGDAGGRQHAGQDGGDAHFHEAVVGAHLDGLDAHDGLGGRTRRCVRATRTTGRASTARIASASARRRRGRVRATARSTAPARGGGCHMSVSFTGAANLSGMTRLAWAIRPRLV